MRDFYCSSRKTIMIIYKVLKLMSFSKYHKTVNTEHCTLSIGASRGRAPCTPPKGPDSFVLTYKIFEM